MRRILFQRIVCAVDHSPYAIQVLGASLQLARLHGAQVRVLHVANRPHSPAGSVQRTLPGALLTLRNRLAELADHDVALQWIVAHDDPAVEVGRYASAVDADLVVIGRSSMPSADSHAEAIVQEVVRHATSPVLVVAADGSSAIPRPPFRHVLCSVASGLSVTTFRYALSLAQEFESRLSLLNVDGVESRPADGWLRSDLQQLRALAPLTAEVWCDTEDVSMVGEPASALADAAALLNPDLIVVGASGAAYDGIGGVVRAALGVDAASVLIVPPPAVLENLEPVSRDVIAAERPLFDSTEAVR
jgi:nucleotide-binding universal stress UspA family protein